MPVGIKNDTHGDLNVAVNGVLSAREPHSFLGINEYGAPSVINTLGNPYAHVVLRGGDTGPNYDEGSVKKTQDLLKKAGLLPNVVIDCSHDNSGKDYKKQPTVFEDVIRQIKNGNKEIVGFMVESYIKEGNQKLPVDLTTLDHTILEHGKSKTDGCIDWETTESLIRDAYRTLSSKIFPVSKV